MVDQLHPVAVLVLLHRDGVEETKRPQAIQALADCGSRTRLTRERPDGGEDLVPRQLLGRDEIDGGDDGGGGSRRGRA